MNSTLPPQKYNPHELIPVDPNEGKTSTMDRIDYFFLGAAFLGAAALFEAVTPVQVGASFCE